jgi:carboxypeptidase family protein
MEAVATAAEFMHRLVFVIGATLLSVSTARTTAQAPTSERPPAASVRPVTAASSLPPARLVPGSKDTMFTSISGNALDSSNAALANHMVRLRDVRVGRIIGTQTTDKAGMFVFDRLEPGSYVVELMAPNQTVLAASDIISVNAGDTATAVVKLAYRVPPYAGIFGNSLTSAAAVAAEAVAAGVLATSIVGSQVSQRTF